ncbi:MAG: DUF4344 domain-containing metallopeptidase [Shimia sp.]
MWWRALLLAALAWGGPVAAQELRPFTRDALLHVVAHEMGHAVIDAFDVPILGNHEVLADAFATVFLLRVLPPDRAEAAIRARAAAHERRGAPGSPFAIHPADARRAGQHLCLLHGLAPGRPDIPGMTDGQARLCAGLSPEIAAGWAPYLDVATSGAPGAGVILDVRPHRWAPALRGTGAADEALALMERIAWPAPVTLTFDACDGSATWRRSERRLTICDALIGALETYARRP